MTKCPTTATTRRDPVPLLPGTPTPRIAATPPVRLHRPLSRTARTSVGAATAAAGAVARIMGSRGARAGTRRKTRAKATARGRVSAKTSKRRRGRTSAGPRRLRGRPPIGEAARRRTAHRAPHRRVDRRRPEATPGTGVGGAGGRRCRSRGGGLAVTRRHLVGCSRRAHITFRRRRAVPGGPTKRAARGPRRNPPERLPPSVRWSALRKRGAIAAGGMSRVVRGGPPTAGAAATRRPGRDAHRNGQGKARRVAPGAANRAFVRAVVTAAGPRGGMGGHASGREAGRRIHPRRRAAGCVSSRSAGWARSART